MSRLHDRLRYQCCFCGQTIDDTVHRITVDVEDGGSQELFTHLVCLRQRLHPSVPLSELDDCRQQPHN